MTVTYIDPNVTQILNWIATDKCMFCGSEQVEGKDRYACFCRECDSCSQRWISNIRKDLDDGRPSHEDCPECQPAPPRPVLNMDVLKAAIFGCHYHPCPSEYCRGAQRSCNDPYDCQPGPKLCFDCFLMSEPPEIEEPFEDLSDAAIEELRWSF